MNFLSHYYFDREIPNCYHTLGTVLPDLLKNADKNIILHPEKLHHPDPRINDIIAGWQKHLEVDRHFHSSEFFITRSHELKLLLAPAIAGSPVKPFFLGHIALELVLDSLLLKTGKISADEFYSHLDSCENSVIDDFLHFAGLQDTRRFFRFLNDFKKSRYLKTYTDTQQVAYALKRICMRIWNNPFTTDQEEKITAILQRYKNALHDNYLTIFEETEARLNEKSPDQA